jgi:hypothetical protein
MEGFSNRNPVPAALSDKPDPSGLGTLGPGAVIHPPPTAGECSEDDPRDLPWIASWSPVDAKARKGHNCLVHTTKAGEYGTTIHTVSKSCEDGMAHTRAGDRIILPDSIPEPFLQTTIDHELIHIFQRRHPNAWIDFYRRNWGFIFHEGPPADLPESIKEARRANPDTWDPDTGGPWPCWQGRFWPVPVYKSIQNPKLRDAVTIWYDGWRREVLQTPPDAWTQFFGDQAQDEHPHELAAVMIVSGDTASEAGRRLQTWWRANGTFVRTE